jgi:cell division protein ZapA (FtsZ GTPase activity inhibitor)
MVPMAATVKIKIQNREFAVKGSDDREQILQVAAYVDQKLKELGDSVKGLTDDRKAILAALDIAGDYFQLLKEKEDLLAEINDRSKRLVQNLDLVLG